MKKLFFICMMAATLLSCKKDKAENPCGIIIGRSATADGLNISYHLVIEYDDHSTKEVRLTNQSVGMYQIGAEYCK